MIHNADLLRSYLDKYDKDWRNSNGGKPIIILHSCASSEFAKEVSKDEDFKDVVFIAPNATLHTSRSGDEKIGDIVLLSGNRVVGKVSGKWEVYKNGVPVKDKNGIPITYDSTAQPGTEGFNYGF